MQGSELKKLIVEEFLGLIEDPRVECTRKHSLETILIASLLAVICGADSFVGIAKFAKAKQDWLAGFLDLSGGVPSHDTIGRVFAVRRVWVSHAVQEIESAERWRNLSTLIQIGPVQVDLRAQ